MNPPSVRFHVGDVLDVLRSMPANSVDLVLSSPPFLALRSYLPADHPDKSKEIGSEPTPGEFVDTILDVIEACDRVLTPHGTLVFEFGDTYAGSGGAGGDYADNGLRAGQGKFDGSGRRNRPADVAAGILAHTKRPGPEGRDHMRGWPLDKSLCLIPQIVTFALSYGFNPLTGRQTERWRIRNVHPWCRPNPPVGALGDKWRPATSYLFSATKSRTRFFDLDAVRVPHKETRQVSEATAISRRRALNRAHPGNTTENAETGMAGNPNGAPPLDYIVLPTAPYSGSHYAVWPPKLLTPFILSMSPEKVCVECGEPSRRIVQGERIADKDDSTRIKTAGLLARSQDRPPEVGWEYERTTLGWTDCGHGSFACAECGVLVGSPESYVCPCGGRDITYVGTHWRPGVVLDPFAGSGTTLMVAAGLGRSAVGIDLDDRNVALAQDRLGLFAPEVIHHSAAVA